MKYDVTVIGSGPGGYVAAIRCAQLGFKTAIIEKYSTLGGTCLNVGCIPSKALLDSTEHYYQAKEKFKSHGIRIENMEVDFPAMINRKNEVVDQTCSGVSFLMDKNKVDVYAGLGTIKSPGKISVSGHKKNDDIETDKIIIATGSKPASLSFINIDKKRVITSTEALSLQKIPGSMIIIGGGIIGVELGSVYARLGTSVTIVEFMDNLIPTMDSDLGREMKKILTKTGVKVLLSHKVKEVKATSRSVTVKADNKKGEEVSLKADYCLVAVGRKPFTDGLGLENIGLETNDLGQIPVNDNLETKVAGVFAIGDVVRGPMLAHKAEEEGIFVAEYMAGQKPHINYRLIPGVAYTWPEVAGVGYMEQELKEKKINYKVGKFPFRASGRARASMDMDGFVKVLADAETDEILGMHMAGPRIADLIIEGVVALEYRASAEDIARMSHPHPTYSEAVKEACLAATENRAIHI